MNTQSAKLTPPPQGYAGWLAELKGFSRANLMYMRAFAAAWPDQQIVQQAVGQLPWCHNLVLLSQLKDPYRFDFLGLSREAGERAVENALVKHPQDNPTIGLLLCKSKNKVVAEYALRQNTQPLGVAEYKLIESLPQELATDLPSIAQIEQELSGKHGLLDEGEE